MPRRDLSISRARGYGPIDGAAVARSPATIPFLRSTGRTPAPLIARIARREAEEHTRPIPDSLRRPWKRSPGIETGGRTWQNLTTNRTAATIDLVPSG